MLTRGIANAIRLKALSADALPQDVLPSFAVLASDEERERKAQASIPGTYHVIAIPESFAHLPEYTTSPRDKDLDPIASPVSRIGESGHLHNPLEIDDPNVVIVKIVRNTRRYAYSHCRDSTQPPDSDLAPPLPVDSALYPAIQSIVDEEPTDAKIDLRDYEISLFNHFRNVVWQQLIAGGTIFAYSDHHPLDAGLFEQETANFPPVGGSPHLLWNTCLLIYSCIIQSWACRLSLDSAMETTRASTACITSIKRMTICKTISIARTTWFPTRFFLPISFF